MRAINKELSLAIAYKNWIEKLDRENKPHPPYNSSANEYYYDVVANLLWAQKGLCAYTEMFLADYTRFSPENWKSGKIGYKVDTFGHLDHYDSSLKETKGWAWDNLFMIHSDVNTKHKRSKKANATLKPDIPEFDPNYYLQYDNEEHFFIPNVERPPFEVESIKEDIAALGLNYGPVVDYRKKVLAPAFDKVHFGLITVAEARNSLNSFFTAFEMGVAHLI